MTQTTSRAPKTTSLTIMHESDAVIASNSQHWRCLTFPSVTWTKIFLHPMNKDLVKTRRSKAEEPARNRSAHSLACSFFTDYCTLTFSFVVLVLESSLGSLTLPFQNLIYYVAKKFINMRLRAHLIKKL